MADLESQLKAAARVMALREATQSPTTAMAYVRELLKEAERDFEGGMSHGMINPKPPKPKAVAVAKPPTSPLNPKAKTGITDQVEGAFADGQVHITKDLTKSYGIAPKAMKKVIGRLVDRGSIKPAGKKGSGAYVRSTGHPTSKTSKKGKKR